ncbi:023L [Cherax quadricarinatus iridovirus]|uniref:Uncharacterized protein n=1 Tax=Shrimp hemocyte iridescent virus TaxID=2039780 RepID=A0A291B0W6_9VIRU|nr:023L [Cherax quadricarinatus iridovirus]YP_010084880.1 hypothetical protein KM509_gp128 [Shrimp hemocyte iridescent virus]UPA43342.1 hypothetical protein 4TH000068 [Iridovirus CN01]ASZ85003.1 023L [Cherax quadricarinatus iridovirus]ATE87137.1 hypothetical protein [Shrimp hemocyte iridescent virus]UPA43577.1 hypothetical protein 3TG000144 [Iridovirus CN01]UPA43612.1 hypothetical protein 1DG000020 [Iridovirus CN01]
MATFDKYYFVSLLNSDNEYIEMDKDMTFWMKHDTEYKLEIRNNHPTRRCRATVYIDGKSIGKFLVYGNNNIVIERPSDDNKARKLTFYDVSSREGEMGGLNASSPDIGKLRVEIQREKPPMLGRLAVDSMIDTVDCHRSRGLRCETDGIGGTALGKKSSQKFYTVCDIDAEPQVYTFNAMMKLVKDQPVVPL